MYSFCGRIDVCGIGRVTSGNKKEPLSDENGSSIIDLLYVISLRDCYNIS